MMQKLITALLLLIALQLPLFAQEKPEQPALIPPKGLIKLEGDYKIFPEGKLGNNLYQKDKRIFTQPGLVIRNILMLNGGLFIYATNKQDKAHIEKIGLPEASFEALEGGFYKLKVDRAKSILRVDPEGNIQNLLPGSKTPDGLATNGKGWAAFSHIIGGETIEENGKKLYLYTYKVHIVKKDVKKVRHWKTTFQSSDLPIKIIWSKANEVSIKVHGTAPAKVSVE